MKATRIFETCLYVDDLKKAEEFYGRVLELESFAKVADRHVFFRCGQAVFLLFNPQSTSAEEHRTHGAMGPGHVAFHMTPQEVESWKAQLRTNGVEIESEHKWPNSGI